MPTFFLLPQILLLLGHLDPHGLIAFSANHIPQSVGRKLTTLRERTVRIRKVVGSIPIRSTIHRKRRSENCGVFSFDHRNTTDGFLL